MISDLDDASFQDQSLKGILKQSSVMTDLTDKAQNDAKTCKHVTFAPDTFLTETLK